MCGITGHFAPGAGADLRGFRQNLRRLHHRGPDQQGVASGEHWALGQTRLEIIGGADVGSQPMQRPGYAFVFNGEIHNYVELGAELLAAGQACDVRSDSSVAFAALVYWGREAVRRFRGFWAFLFVDEVAGEVWCCRDRYGQKPLVYTDAAPGLRFASEAHALGVALVLAASSVRAFLADAQYPAAPATMYENVRQVRPGSLVSVDLRTHALNEWVYYRVGESEVLIQPYGEAVAGFAERLETSLRLRLRADVPVGLLLSSGKDSGTLHAMLRAFPKIPAFTYEQAGVEDEACAVRQWYAAERAITNATRSTNLPGRVAAIHRSLDAPMLSASLLALDALYSTASAAGVPVLLSGQGADEVLGGYHYYSGLQASKLWALRSRIASLGGLRAAWGAYRDARAAGALTAGLALALVGSDPHDELKTDRGPDAVTERRRADVAGRQLQSMLWYEDRISMLHSVETRCPFLDVDLVEFCLAQPGHYFVRGHRRKRLLESAFGAMWPRELRWERTKKGLPASEATILSEHEAFVREGLTIAADYLHTAPPDGRAVRTALRGPRGAKAVWRLSMLGHWLGSTCA